MRDGVSCEVCACRKWNRQTQSWACRKLSFTFYSSAMLLQQQDQINLHLRESHGNNKV